MVQSDTAPAETPCDHLIEESAAEKSNAMMNAAVVSEIREAHRRVFGNTNAFVIDDIANLEQWARHGRKTSEAAMKFIAKQAQELGLE